MYNTIPTVEGNVFNRVSKKTRKEDYWLSGENNLKGISIPKVPGMPDVFQDIQIMTPEEARKTHNIKLIGISIASVTILTAAGLFLLLKGGPKGLTKGFIKFRNYLEEKIQKSRLDNPDNPNINKLYALTIKSVDNILNHFEAINNFSTLKDFAFKKFMIKTGKIGAKIHSKITKTFEKIGRQTVVNSYRVSKSNLSNARDIAKIIENRLLQTNLSEKIEINGETKTLHQWLQKLSDMNEEIATIYDNHFNKEGLFGRYLKIKQSVNSMNQEFENKGNFWFWSTDTLNSFVAESAIVDSKKAIQHSVQGFRREISYSPKDLVRDAQNLILKMTRSVDYKDNLKITKLREMNLDISNLTKISDEKEFKVARENIFKKIDDFTNEVLLSLKNKEINTKTAQSLLEDILTLRSGIKDFRQGKVEEMLQIYEKIANPTEYRTVKKSYEKAVNSLDKSINIETEDFYSKVRDLTLGSAPTDILSVLGAFGTLCYYLGTSDNRQERESVLLKYGIPALAGIGTSLFCNARLFAGSKGMLFAAISAIITGKIGDIADNFLKKQYSNKELNNSN